MKKLVSLFLIFSIFMLSLTSCKSSQSSYSYDDYEEHETEETTEEQTIYIPETTKSPTPVSEWGFYNLDEMGNMLVEISGYNLKADEPYVYYAHNEAFTIISIDDSGYCYSYKIVEDGNEKYTLKKNALEGNFEIVDNDSIYDRSNGESFIIDGRKIVTNDFVVFTHTAHFFRTHTEWFVPSSFIDWEKGIEKYIEDPSYPNNYGYKFYLK